MNHDLPSSHVASCFCRWSARVTSVLLLGLVVLLVIGHGGLPNVLQQPAPVQIEFAGLGLMLLGFVIGWVWEGLGGLIVLFGLAAINAVEFTVNHRPALGAFPWFAVPGVLFVLTSLLGRNQSRTAHP